MRCPLLVHASIMLQSVNVTVMIRVEVAASRDVLEELALHAPRYREACRLCHRALSQECDRSRRWSDRTCRLRRVCTTSGSCRRSCQSHTHRRFRSSRAFGRWLDWSEKSPNENEPLWLQAQVIQWPRAATQQNKCMPNDPSSSWSSF